MGWGRPSNGSYIIYGEVTMMKGKCLHSSLEGKLHGMWSSLVCPDCEVRVHGLLRDEDPMPWEENEEKIQREGD